MDVNVEAVVESNNAEAEQLTCVPAVEVPKCQDRNQVVHTSNQRGSIGSDKNLVDQVTDLEVDGSGGSSTEAAEEHSGVEAEPLTYAQASELTVYRNRNLPTHESEPNNAIGLEEDINDQATDLEVKSSEGSSVEAAIEHCREGKEQTCVTPVKPSDHRNSYQAVHKSVQCDDIGSDKCSINQASDLDVVGNGGSREAMTENDSAEAESIYDSVVKPSELWDKNQALHKTKQYNASGLDKGMKEQATDLEVKSSKGSRFEATTEHCRDGKEQSCVSPVKHSNQETRNQVADVSELCDTIGTDKSLVDQASDLDMVGNSGSSGAVTKNYGTAAETTCDPAVIPFEHRKENNALHESKHYDGIGLDKGMKDQVTDLEVRSSEGSRIEAATEHCRDGKEETYNLPVKLSIPKNRNQMSGEFKSCKTIGSDRSFVDQASDLDVVGSSGSVAVSENCSTETQTTYNPVVEPSESWSENKVLHEFKQHNAIELDEGMNDQTKDSNVGSTEGSRIEAVTEHCNAGKGEICDRQVEPSDHRTMNQEADKSKPWDNIGSDKSFIDQASNLGVVGSGGSEAVIENCSTDAETICDLVVESSEYWNEIQVLPEFKQQDAIGLDEGMKDQATDLEIRTSKGGNIEAATENSSAEKVETCVSPVKPSDHQNSYQGERESKQWDSIASDRSSVDQATDLNVVGSYSSKEAMIEYCSTEAESMCDLTVKPSEHRNENKALYKTKQHNAIGLEESMKEQATDLEERSSKGTYIEATTEHCQDRKEQSCISPVNLSDHKTRDQVANVSKPCDTIGSDKSLVDQASDLDVVGCSGSSEAVTKNCSAEAETTCDPAVTLSEHGNENHAFHKSKQYDGIGLDEGMKDKMMDLDVRSSEGSRIEAATEHWRDGKNETCDPPVKLGNPKNKNQMAGESKSNHTIGSDRCFVDQAPDLDVVGSCGSEAVTEYCSTEAETTYNPVVEASVYQNENQALHESKQHSATGLDEGMDDQAKNLNIGSTGGNQIETTTEHCRLGKEETWDPSVKLSNPENRNQTADESNSPNTIGSDRSLVDQASDLDVVGSGGNGAAKENCSIKGETTCKPVVKPSQHRNENQALHKFKQHDDIGLEEGMKDQATDLDARNSKGSSIEAATENCSAGKEETCVPLTKPSNHRNTYRVEHESEQCDSIASDKSSDDQATDLNIMGSSGSKEAVKEYCSIEAESMCDPAVKPSEHQNENHVLLKTKTHKAIRLDKGMKEQAKNLEVRSSKGTHIVATREYYRPGKEQTCIPLAKPSNHRNTYRVEHESNHGDSIGSDKSAVDQEMDSSDGSSEAVTENCSAEVESIFDLSIKPSEHGNDSQALHKSEQHDAIGVDQEMNDGATDLEVRSSKGSNIEVATEYCRTGKKQTCIWPVKPSNHGNRYQAVHKSMQCEDIDSDKSSIDQTSNQDVAGSGGSSEAVTENFSAKVGSKCEAVVAPSEHREENQMLHKFKLDDVIGLDMRTNDRARDLEIGSSERNSIEATTKHCCADAELLARVLAVVPSKHWIRNQALHGSKKQEAMRPNKFLVDRVTGLEVGSSQVSNSEATIKHSSAVVELLTPVPGVEVLDGPYRNHVLHKSKQCEAVGSDNSLVGQVTVSKLNRGKGDSSKAEPKYHGKEAELTTCIPEGKPATHVNGNQASHIVSDKNLDDQKTEADNTKGNSNEVVMEHPGKDVQSLSCVPMSELCVWGDRNRALQKSEPQDDHGSDHNLHDQATDFKVDNSGSTWGGSRGGNSSEAETEYFSAEGEPSCDMTVKPSIHQNRKKALHKSKHRGIIRSNDSSVDQATCSKTDSGAGSDSQTATKHCYAIGEVLTRLLKIIPRKLLVKNQEFHESKQRDAIVLDKCSVNPPMDLNVYSSEGSSNEAAMEHPGIEAQLLTCAQVVEPSVQWNRNKAFHKPEPHNVIGSEYNLLDQETSFEVNNNDSDSSSGSGSNSFNSSKTGTELSSTEAKPTCVWRVKPSKQEKRNQVLRKSTPSDTEKSDNSLLDQATGLEVESSQGSSSGAAIEHLSAVVEPSACHPGVELRKCQNGNQALHKSKQRSAFRSDDSLVNRTTSMEVDSSRGSGRNAVIKHCSSEAMMSTHVPAVKPLEHTYRNQALHESKQGDAVDSDSGSIDQDTDVKLYGEGSSSSKAGPRDYVKEVELTTPIPVGKPSKHRNRNQVLHETKQHNVTRLDDSSVVQAIDFQGEGSEGGSSEATMKDCCAVAELLAYVLTVTPSKHWLRDQTLYRSKQFHAIRSDENLVDQTTDLEVDGSAGSSKEAAIEHSSAEAEPLTSAQAIEPSMCQNGNQPLLKFKQNYTIGSDESSGDQAMDFQVESGGGGTGNVATKQCYTDAEILACVQTVDWIRNQVLHESKQRSAISSDKILVKGSTSMEVDNSRGSNKKATMKHGSTEAMQSSRVPAVQPTERPHRSQALHKSNLCHFIRSYNDSANHLTDLGVASSGGSNSRARTEHRSRAVQLSTPCPMVKPSEHQITNQVLHKPKQHGLIRSNNNPVAQATSSKIDSSVSSSSSTTTTKHCSSDIEPTSVPVIKPSKCWNRNYMLYKSKQHNPIRSDNSIFDQVTGSQSDIESNTGSSSSEAAMEDHGMETEQTIVPTIESSVSRNRDEALPKSKQCGTIRADDRLANQTMGIEVDSSQGCRKKAVIKHSSAEAMLSTPVPVDKPSECPYKNQALYESKQRDAVDSDNGSEVTDMELDGGEGSRSKAGPKHHAQGAELITHVPRGKPSRDQHRNQVLQETKQRNATRLNDSSIVGVTDFRGEGNEGSNGEAAVKDCCTVAELLAHILPVTSSKHWLRDQTLYKSKPFHAIRSDNGSINHTVDSEGGSSKATTEHCSVEAKPTCLLSVKSSVHHNRNQALQKAKQHAAVRLDHSSFDLEEESSGGTNIEAATELGSAEAGLLTDILAAEPSKYQHQNQALHNAIRLNDSSVDGARGLDVESSGGSSSKTTRKPRSAEAKLTPVSVVKLSRRQNKDPALHKFMRCKAIRGDNSLFNKAAGLQVESSKGNSGKAAMKLPSAEKGLSTRLSVIKPSNNRNMDQLLHKSEQYNDIRSNFCSVNRVADMDVEAIRGCKGDAATKYHKAKAEPSTHVLALEPSEPCKKDEALHNTEQCVAIGLDDSRAAQATDLEVNDTEGSSSSAVTKHCSIEAELTPIPIVKLYATTADETSSGVPLLGKSTLAASTSATASVPSASDVSPIDILTPSPIVVADGLARATKGLVGELLVNRGAGGSINRESEPAGKVPSKLPIDKETFIGQSEIELALEFLENAPAADVKSRFGCCAAIRYFCYESSNVWRQIDDKLSVLKMSVHLPKYVRFSLLKSHGLQRQEVLAIFETVAHVVFGIIENPNFAKKFDELEKIFPLDGGMALELDAESNSELQADGFNIRKLTPTDYVTETCGWAYVKNDTISDAFQKMFSELFPTKEWCQCIAYWLARLFTGEASMLIVDREPGLHGPFSLINLLKMCMGKFFVDYEDATTTASKEHLEIDVNDKMATFLQYKRLVSTSQISTAIRLVDNWIQTGGRGVRRSTFAARPFMILVCTSIEAASMPETYAKFPNNLVILPTSIQFLKNNQLPNANLRDFSSWSSSIADYCGRQARGPPPPMPHHRQEQLNSPRIFINANSNIGEKKDGTTCNSIVHAGSASGSGNSSSSKGKEDNSKSEKSEIRGLLWRFFQRHITFEFGKDTYVRVTHLYNRLQREYPNLKIGKAELTDYLNVYSQAMGWGKVIKKWQPPISYYPSPLNILNCIPHHDLWEEPLTSVQAEEAAKAYAASIDAGKIPPLPPLVAHQIAQNPTPKRQTSSGVARGWYQCERSDMSVDQLWHCNSHKPRRHRQVKNPIH